MRWCNAFISQNLVKVLGVISPNTTQSVKHVAPARQKNLKIAVQNYIPLHALRAVLAVSTDIQANSASYPMQDRK